MKKFVLAILLSVTILSLLAINGFGESSAQLSPSEREIDGSMNHPLDYGEANQPLNRTLSIGYLGGVSVPRGGDNPNSVLPSARNVSNFVSAQSSSVTEPSGASDMFWLWGQFVDHDMDLTGGLNPAVDFNILVPTGDPFFDPMSTGIQEIDLNRSVFTMVSGVREQTNQITSFIDGSNVYGSDSGRNSFIRANDGSGKLVTSAGNLLPFNDGTQDNAGGPGTTLFVAGDVRANEHVALTAMHTIFVREHNKIVDEIEANNPSVFTGDQKYNKAKRILEGKIQFITYNEFLPILLGPNAITPWSSYTGVDPRVANEFSTAAYRFGHTMLSTHLERSEVNGSPSPGGPLPLLGAFFNPGFLTSIEVDRLMRGLAGNPAQAVDTLIIDDVRNFLFGPPGSGGFDLASLNIQRGRDHGIPSYNQARMDLGLSAKTSYLQITGENPINSPIADGLEQAYGTGNVDDVDLWSGGLAEPRVSGAIVGETFLAILTDQFQRSMDGDLYWYENRYAEGDLTDMELMMIENSSLANIIMRNTGIQFINQDVYLVDETTLEDSDLDTMMNYLDNCEFVFNPNQLDANENGVGDLCEPMAVGGEMILVDTTVLVLAGTQYMGAWLIPVIVSSVGFVIVILRKI